jgi:hypothetical protein
MARDTFILSKRRRGSRPREFFCIFGTAAGSTSGGSGGLIFGQERVRLSYSVELRGVFRIMEIAITGEPGQGTTPFRFVVFSEPAGLASGCLMGRVSTSDVAFIHHSLVAGDSLWMEALTDRGVFRGALRQVVRDAKGDLAMTASPDTEGIEH